MPYQIVPPKPYISSLGVNYNLEYDPVNGKVQLIQQNAPTGTVPVYADGRWNSNATPAGFDSVEQQTIHNNIQVAIRDSFRRIGGTSKGYRLPAWAAPQQQGQAPGQSTITPSAPVNQNAANPANIGAGVGAILNPDVQLANIPQQFGVGNESRLFSSAMKYPLDLKIQSQDILVISAYEYVAPNRESLLNGNMASIIQKGLFRGADRLQNPVGTVFFPMPNGVAEAKEVGWGPDNLNTLNASVLNDVMKTTEKYATAAGLGAGVGGGLAGFLTKSPSAALSGAAGGAQLGLQATAFGQALAAATGSPDALGLLSAAGLEKITTMAQFGVPAETILSRTAGVVTNENLELLFSGPQLRSFSVSYRLTARSEREAREIRRIIRFFKQTMAPRKRSGAAGQQSVFLGTPNVYKLNFQTAGGADIKGVSRFKTCALTNFQTDYTPDGQWMAFDEGQPVSTRITMAFTELEPIYDTDYQTNIYSSRTDLAQIRDDEIGY